MRKFLIFFICMCLTSCCVISDMERDAHQVNGERYIPMLKTYIDQDEALDVRLKDTYKMGLDTWWELIKTRAEE